MVSTNL